MGVAGDALADTKASIVPFLPVDAEAAPADAFDSCMALQVDTRTEADKRSECTGSVASAVAAAVVAAGDEASGLATRASNDWEHSIREQERAVAVATGSYPAVEANGEAAAVVVAAAGGPGIFAVLSGSASHAPGPGVVVKRSAAGTAGTPAFACA